MWWQQSAPSSIILDLGPIKIHWYGICLVLGLSAALVVIIKEAGRRQLDLDKLYNLLFYLIVFGFIGARLWEVLIYSWSYFKVNPLAIFKIWQGGLAIHGALLGGVITLLVWLRHKRELWRQYFDLLVLGLPLGQAIGRWGNYFNQELFGLPTASWLGIYIQEPFRPLALVGFITFHPVFLYESLLLLLLFFCLYRYRTNLGLGRLFGGYLLGYGLIRFGLEFIIVDEVGSFLGCRVPQIVSLIMILIGAVLLLPKKDKSATISPLS